MILALMNMLYNRFYFFGLTRPNMPSNHKMQLNRTGNIINDEFQFPLECTLNKTCALERAMSYYHPPIFTQSLCNNFNNMICILTYTIRDASNQLQVHTILAGITYIPQEVITNSNSIRFFYMFYRGFTILNHQLSAQNLTFFEFLTKNLNSGLKNVETRSTD